MLKTNLVLALLSMSALAGDLRGEVTVMTQNLYVGFDVEVFAANLLAEPANVVPLTTEAYADVLAADFPARAAAMALYIERARPEVIGLQEVALFRSGDFDGFGAPHATHVELDYLDILLDALAARGLDYSAVATVVNADAEFPRLAGFDENNQPIAQDIRLTDRDVVLVRSDLPPAEFSFTNPRTGNFAAAASVLGTPLPRGWASVDVQAEGLAFRFLTAHLDTDEDLQALQIGELVGPGGPVDTELPVVMAGDFNARADGAGTANYLALLAAGYEDAWSVLRPGEAGLTWGQDADLLNAESKLSERLDLILHRGGLVATAVELFGEEQADRTFSGLWPSDHAGVVATIVPEPGGMMLTFAAAIVVAIRRTLARRPAREPV